MPPPPPILLQPCHQAILGWRNHTETGGEGPYKIAHQKFVAYARKASRHHRHHYPDPRANLKTSNPTTSTTNACYIKAIPHARNGGPERLIRFGRLCAAGAIPAPSPTYIRVLTTLLSLLPNLDMNLMNLTTYHG
ncbi:hypothetical protein V500_00461 [Pseudogymnoascus sp. VKM F-4518 (FW-2643)]|nr:hypothetical protein V500_00461 [Pseudogymnoascus sp. VKM F-4518 (FW-2643)]